MNDLINKLQTLKANDDIDTFDSLVDDNALALAQHFADDVTVDDIDADFAEIVWDLID